MDKKKVLKVFADFMESGMDNIAAANKTLEVLSPGPPFNLVERGEINDITFRSKEARKIVSSHMPAKRWKVCSLDVWGNVTDGFEVNDEFKVGEIEVPAGADESDLLKILKEEGHISKNVKLNQVEFGQDSESFFSVSEKRAEGPSITATKRGNRRSEPGERRIYDPKRAQDQKRNRRQCLPRLGLKNTQRDDVLHSSKRKGRSEVEHEARERARFST